MSLTSFSDRLRDTPNIVWPGHPTPPGLNVPFVLAVGNQLLITRDTLAEKYSVAWLATNGFHPRLLTTLLHGLPNPKAIPDVGIWEINVPSGANVFSVVAKLRVTPGVDPGPSPLSNVSPNHILVPAPLAHSCPFGSPAPLPGPRPLIPAAGSTKHNVTVIDSGYQWNGEWGLNQLKDRLVGGTDIQADRLPRLAEVPNNALGAWQPGTPDVASWVGCPADKSPEVTAAGDLMALAGHANFIAGVIAQKSPDASITIRNHNGFDPSTDDFPTEATVARSLCVAGLQDLPKVINVGFAFYAYDSVNADQSQPQISRIWETACEYIDDEASTGTPVIVAPAGNQASDVAPLYPAALWTKATTAPALANVVGVASIDANPAGSRSSFSNYGSWVTCSAVGSKVHSTFLHVDMRLEDADSLESADFTHNSWAIWNGTSFATPKVVAAICNELAEDVSPKEAVAAVLGAPFPRPVPALSAVEGDGLGVKLPLL